MYLPAKEWRSVYGVMYLWVQDDIWSFEICAKEPTGAIRILLYAHFK